MNVIFLLCTVGEKETEEAFAKHFEQQLSYYGNVTCLSLVERLGREKIMADAFLHHVVLYNSRAVAYVAFDFHEYWLVCRILNMNDEQDIILTHSIVGITPK